MAREKLTLASMCGGGVQERINRCLAKISDNILDPNTEGKKKRTLTVQITFVPCEEDREDVAVDVSCNVKLAPEMGLSTQLYISKNLDTGEVNLTEHAKGQIKGQLTLDDMGMEANPDMNEAATAEELGCDPETGEVIETAGPKKMSSVINMRSVMNG